MLHVAAASLGLTAIQSGTVWSNVQEHSVQNYLQHHILKKGRDKQPVCMNIIFWQLNVKHGDETR